MLIIPYIQLVEKGMGKIGEESSFWNRVNTVVNTAVNKHANIST